MEQWEINYIKAKQLGFVLMNIEHINPVTVLIKFREGKNIDERRVIKNKMITVSPEMVHLLKERVEDEINNLILQTIIPLKGRPMRTDLEMELNEKYNTISNIMGSIADNIKELAENYDFDKPLEEEVKVEIQLPPMEVATVEIDLNDPAPFIRQMRAEKVNESCIKMVDEYLEENKKKEGEEEILVTQLVPADVVNMNMEIDGIKKPIEDYNNNK